LLPALLGMAPAPVCWRIEGSAGNGNPVEHHSQATAGAANPRTAQEGRRGPAQKLPQASWPRRNKQETPPLAAKAPDETARQAVRGARHQPSGPPPRGLPGRRTATKERTPAPMAAPGSANTRRARGAGRPRTGNSGNGYPPTSPVFFFFGRGLHKPVAFVARAGLPPCVLANLGRKRGQGSGTTTPDHGNTGARGWDLSTVTRSGSGHSGVRKRQPHSRRFRRPPQHRQRS
jgi:hypothetical protein